jgi:hypothetical protein
MRVEVVFSDFLKTLAFFSLIRVLKGRGAILKIDAFDANPIILFFYYGFEG